MTMERRVKMQKTIQVADKPTLDEIKKEIGNIKNSIQDVATNALVTGMTHAKRFTSDAIFTVPNGITEIIMLGCGSGKGRYAGEFLLPTRYTVVPGEEINIVCGMNDSKGYKDTVVTSTSLGTITLLAGVVSGSLQNNILGIPLGIKGGDGGSGSSYGSLSGGGYAHGGAGGYGGAGGLYGIGGGGAGGGGSYSRYGGGAGGGTSGYVASDSSGGAHGENHILGENAGKSGNRNGGDAGNACYYGAGGGGAGGYGEHDPSISSGWELSYPGYPGGSAGKPSGGMIQIEW